MWLRRTFALALITSASALSAATLPPVESMPTLDSASLAPSSLLDGVGYTIDSSVPVVGYMGQFTLHAAQGTFVADGVEMLGIRIGELASIAQLSQLSQTGVFANALAASAVNTGAAIGKAVMNPVGTIAGIPAGVGRFFESAATAISRATESGDGQGTGTVALDALGLNKAKRQIAKQVGADPYTTNPVLAKQIDDLARASLAGGISLDAALAVSTAGVATAISATATVSNLVWERSPADIRTINENKLAAMGVNADTVRAFVTNPWFTPTLSVPLVENLQQLASVRGRPAAVVLASRVASESEARFVLNALTMARRASSERDPVVSLEFVQRIMTARMRSQRVIVPAPVDYVAWTAPVRDFAQRTIEGGNREILVTGIASERAREGLRATGWKLAEHSPR